MNTLTVKIPFELEQAANTLAARTHQTRSEVVRQALHAYVQQDQQPDSAGLLAAVPDLVGCFVGGSADLSANPAHMAEFGQSLVG